MRILCVGDLHFGIKTNSISWLESQLKWFNEQLFETLKNKNIDRCVFLGDIFDIRYSIQQQVGIEVKKVFRKMLKEFNNIEFFIVAGNHDYYSPLEEFSEYNAYNLVFGEEFLELYKNLKIVYNEPYRTKDGALFLPWYWTENPDHFDELLYNFNFAHDISAIFCHADLVQWPGPRIASLKGCPIFSGHIHNIQFDNLSKLYNLGAAFPLTFNDVNESRYIWILEDNKIIDKIENITTPKFKRIYNEDIFNIDAKEVDNAYVQLCISSANISKARYVEQIKNIKLEFPNNNIRIHVITDEVDFTTLDANGFDININKYIENNIPEHLENKYTMIKNKINEQK